MDTEKLAQAAVPEGPHSKNEAGQGEICLAVTAEQVVMAIPSWLAGKLAQFTAAGAAVDCLDGLSTVEVVHGQVSAIDETSKAVTVHANTGRRVPDGQTRAWLVPPPGVATHMAFEASGAGKLYIAPVSQPMAFGTQGRDIFRMVGNEELMMAAGAQVMGGGEP